MMHISLKIEFFETKSDLFTVFFGFVKMLQFILHFFMHSFGIWTGQISRLTARAFQPYDLSITCPMREVANSLFHSSWIIHRVSVICCMLSLMSKNSRKKMQTLIF